MTSCYEELHDIYIEFSCDSDVKGFSFLKKDFSSTLFMFIFYFNFILPGEAQSLKTARLGSTFVIGI